MEKDRADAPVASAQDTASSAVLDTAQAAIARLEGELRAAKRVKSDFMARMTHELRTPLSAIIGLANLAIPLAGEANLADYLEKIHTCAKGLLDVVDDITDFSRLEKGLVDLDVAPFDLDVTLDRAIGCFAAAAKSKGVRLEIHLDPLVPVKLVGDGSRLESVLAHLVGNAVKFTAVGRVDVAVTARGRHDGTVRLVFSVRDTGIGMASETIPDMLDSFTQADGSLSRPYGGTGLGLALVRHGAALLGGELQVESEPGRGTVFSFEADFTEDRCPYSPAVVSPPALPEPETAGTDQTPLAGRRLLLVEDNTINQQVAREILVRLGAAVDVAVHGRQAVEMVDRTRYDAVFMDVQMPVMDGLEATRRIRGLPGGAAVPIIALTAHALAEDRARCLAVGMNDYLTKPIDPGRLLVALDRLIAPHAPVVPAAPAVVSPEAPASPPMLGIEAAKALARLGGNARLLSSVGAEFVRDYASSAEDLDRLTRQGDLEGARRLVHTVKGVAGNIAADALAAAARDIENALAGGALPTATAREDYAAALQATVDDASRLARPTPSSPSCRGQGCLHVLLVDDAKLNRAVFAQILRGAGHDVVTAPNGKEACRLLFGDVALARSFDCILMDLEMPEMDGLTACRIIRGLLAASAHPPCRRDIPIVALTSHGVEAERERCLAAGMDACLPKIFEHQAFLDALAAVLRERGLEGGTGHARPGGASGGGATTLLPIVRGLAGFLRVGSIRAEEGLEALRQALVGQTAPPELDELAAHIERYAFAEALDALRALAAHLGLDQRVWDKSGQDAATG